MNSFFNPIDIAKINMQAKNLADLTPAQKAGKLIVSTVKMGGEDYTMWSKYDDKGVLMQRAMLRADLIEEQTQGEVKIKADPAEDEMKDFF